MPRSHVRTRVDGSFECSLAWVRIQTGQTGPDSWSNGLADPGKLGGVVKGGQVRAVHEGEVFPDGVARSNQNGVEIEIVTEILQERGNRPEGGKYWVIWLGAQYCDPPTLVSALLDPCSVAVGYHLYLQRNNRVTSEGLSVIENLATPVFRFMLIHSLVLLHL